MAFNLSALNAAPPLPGMPGAIQPPQSPLGQQMGAAPFQPAPAPDMGASAGPGAADMLTALRAAMAGHGAQAPTTAAPGVSSNSMTPPAAPAPTPIASSPQNPTWSDMVAQFAKAQGGLGGMVQGASNAVQNPIMQLMSLLRGQQQAPAPAAPMVAPRPPGGLLPQPLG